MILNFHQRPLVLQPVQRCRLAAFALLTTLLLAVMPAGAQSGNAPDSESMPGGPIRLRQPTQSGEPANSRVGPRLNDAGQTAQQAAGALILSAPSDFELYVRKQTRNVNVRRFGSGLIEGLLPSGDVADYNPLVPPDYLVRVGDELVLNLWGSVDADLRLRVDNTGRISIPRVGPVTVTGVRLGDLPDVVRRRVGAVFKNFDLSITLSQLRGQRVYVTGFVHRPGTITVNGLATLAQALMRAGGPSAAGSFRDIQLRRGGKTMARFDLYDLLLRGDRSADMLLQADDVIHVGPVGSQVALVGSINQPAIFEIKPDETVDDVLKMAGGFNAVADRSQLTLERLDETLSARIRRLEDRKSVV